MFDLEPRKTSIFDTNAWLEHLLWAIVQYMQCQLSAENMYVIDLISYLLYIYNQLIEILLITS